MKPFRQTWTAIRALLVLTLVLGVGYPLLITGIGQLAFANTANGQLVRIDGNVAGSALIGQSFTDSDGVALPEWFQSRPSAAGDGYDASASSGSNYGTENEDLVAAIGERQSAIEALDGAGLDRAGLDGAGLDGIPADAVTSSGSGLDPHISPDYARLQVPRVAEARGLNTQDVSNLVESMIQGRDLGYLGEPTVNVLQLNIALAGLGGQE